MNVKQIPKGYVSSSRHHIRRFGTIVQWFPVSGEGYIFTNVSVFHKHFKIPFALEQIADPDPRDHELSSIIRQGMGIEFNLIVKEHKELAKLSYDITNNDLMIWNCKLITDLHKRKNNSRHWVNLFNNSFLIRRNELRD